MGEESEQNLQIWVNIVALWSVIVASFIQLSNKKQIQIQEGLFSKGLLPEEKGTVAVGEEDYCNREKVYNACKHLRVRQKGLLFYKEE